MRFPVIIGVVGGIGSGKMAFCKALQKHLADKYKITACILNEGLQNLSVPQNDGNEINRIMESVKADVVMVKGHSFFHDEKLRSRFDFKIFLNSDDDVRLAKFGEFRIG
ncbi:hypothetical protein AB6A40_008156 [Gnathostoma spinigerum]|uniref:Dephospho-CoA kinase n=1 Tax=Gnathostoma spinigerum TaxID=75299 RepID=A0ABD6EQM0_9BILA